MRGAIKSICLCEVLLLALRRADGVLCVLAVKICGVSAHYAPAKSSRINSELILNLDIWTVSLYVRDWIQRNFSYLFLKSDTFNVLINLPGNLFLALAIVLILDSFGVLMAFHNRKNSGIMETHIVNQILDNCINILVQGRESHIRWEFVYRNDRGSFD